MNILTPVVALLGLVLLGGSCTKDPGPAPVADFTHRIDSTGWGERTLRLRNTSVNASEFVWNIRQPKGRDYDLQFTTSDVDLVITRNGPVQIQLTAKQGDVWSQKEKTDTLKGITPVGSVVFGKNADVTGEIDIWVDTIYRGRIIKSYVSPGPFDCGQEGSLTVPLERGNHRYTVKWPDGYTVADLSVYIQQDQCERIILGSNTK